MLPSTDFPQTAERNAKDLNDVLGTVGLASPYILIAHSHGAIVARVVRTQGRRRNGAYREILYTSPIGNYVRYIKIRLHC